VPVAELDSPGRHREPFSVVQHRFRVERLGHVTEGECRAALTHRLDERRERTGVVTRRLGGRRPLRSLLARGYLHGPLFIQPGPLAGTVALRHQAALGGVAELDA
jgi:hypothetical protein